MQFEYSEESFSIRVNLALKVNVLVIALDQSSCRVFRQQACDIPLVLLYGRHGNAN